MARKYIPDHKIDAQKDQSKNKKKFKYCLGNVVCLKKALHDKPSCYDQNTYFHSKWGEQGFGKLPDRLLA